MSLCQSHCEERWKSLHKELSGWYRWVNSLQITSLSGLHSTFQCSLPLSVHPHPRPSPLAFPCSFSHSRSTLSFITVLMLSISLLLSPSFPLPFWLPFSLFFSPLIPLSSFFLFIKFCDDIHACRLYQYLIFKFLIFNFKGLKTQLLAPKWCKH